MRSLGIFVAPSKPYATELTRHLVRLAEAHQVTVRLQRSCADQIDRTDLVCDSDEAVASCDVLVTLSGDGGVLKAARAAAPHGTPVLAVDLGRLGFLSAVRPQDVEEAFTMLLNGEFSIEERMMLEARVVRQGPGVRGQGSENATKGIDTTQQEHHTPPDSYIPNSKLQTPNSDVIAGSIGLNDAVVAKSALARILRLSIFVAGEQVATVRADGLVVATPTGSTAYALSAGGPIVHPEVPLLLICPICAHSLTQRPLVVGPDETIEVLAEWEGDEVSSSELEAMLTIDGQVGIFLQSGDRVRVRRATATARLLHLPTHSFYSRLREKMSWGE
jgi:NAD+ kinase